MKKILSLILAVLLLLSVVGCGVVDDELVSDIIDAAVSSAEERATSPVPAPTQELQIIEPETHEDAPEVKDEAPQETEEAVPPAETAAPTEAEPVIDEDGQYTTKDDVALYIHTYGHLPSNFITKKEAQALGWPGGSLEPYAPGYSIGGDNFGNFEKLLPNGKYRECDIDTMGAKSRGAKRIVFSDTAIYYTDDHYETFTQLY